MDKMLCMNQRDFRASCEMSLAEFARRIGVGYQAAWKYEKLGRAPCPRVMRRIQEEFPEINIGSYYNGRPKQTDR